MDRLEQNVHKLWRRLKNLSLRRALGYYMILAIIVVVLCTVLTHMFCTSWENLVFAKYELGSSNYQVSLTDKEGYLYRTIDNLAYIEESQTPQEKGNNILWMIQVIKTGSVLLYSIIAILITSHFYYRNKLEEPLRLLQQEADCIAREDLSFSCTYGSLDEMGEVCDNFDKMRRQLVKNKKNLWSLMEEQRQLNAAFAHDLRTPLTVMSGYIEMLDSSYPEGNISQEEFQKFLQLMHRQVKRLEDFSETMKTIHTFEQMEVRKEKVSLNKLWGRIQDSLKGLSSASGLSITQKDCGENVEVYLDTRLFMEVFDNLMSNAMRYAKTHIEVQLQMVDRQLILFVRDNGSGFDQGQIRKAMNPYYTGESSSEHYGLGLTICKLLCEKHGGSLRISNSIQSGAVIGAEFYVL